MDKSIAVLFVSQQVYLHLTPLPKLRPVSLKFDGLLPAEMAIQRL